MGTVPGLRIGFRRRAIKAMSHVHTAVYRTTGGRFLDSVSGVPVLLLTTTGRRTGKRRTTPLLFFRDGPDLVVIGSNGGADRPPDWLRNLEHEPRATVSVRGGRRSVTGSVAAPERRARLWAVATAAFPGYAAYQRRTEREIPVVVLTPTEG